LSAGGNLRISSAAFGMLDSSLTTGLLARIHPLVDLGGEGKHDRAFLAVYAVHRHPEGVLPALCLTWG
jgi:hypothetical protein